MARTRAGVTAADILPVPTEEEEQIQLMRWAHLMRRNHPELMMLHHIPNGGSRGKVEAARFKAAGVKSGVPDLCLPIPSGQYHSLYIEMKAKDGKPEPEQLWWAEHLKANGNAHAICYGWEQAKEVLLWYLNLKQ